MAYMRHLTVLLDLNKARHDNLIVDREKFLQKYDSGKSTMTMMIGTPILQNVEGSYIRQSDILSLVDFDTKIRLQRLWASDKMFYITYKWRR